MYFPCKVDQSFEICSMVDWWSKQTALELSLDPSLWQSGETMVPSNASIKPSLAMWSQFLLVTESVYNKCTALFMTLGSTNSELAPSLASSASTCSNACLISATTLGITTEPMASLERVGGDFGLLQICFKANITLDFTLPPNSASSFTSMRMCVTKALSLQNAFQPRYSVHSWPIIPATSERIGLLESAETELRSRSVSMSGKSLFCWKITVRCLTCFVKFVSSTNE
mmetsp:Transcript_104846/g.326929  ORF Transcript_104846/g.326929 Transcript_104846/m.326929 type:complete len:228 (+) Transcript_104846:322-1005(+)